MPNHLAFLLIAGLAALLLGVFLLARARAADLRNYLIQKATPLPLALVNERDDVWLRGEGRGGGALVAPHFDLPCLCYRYHLEERVKRTRTTKKGTETYYTWETRERRDEAARFHLHQGELAIAIDGAEARFHDLQAESDRVGEWRHSISFLPDPCEVSAVGTVSAGRARLEPWGDIPLLVTPRERAAFLRSAERGESLLRGGGSLLVWAGLGAGAYGLLERLAWPVNTIGRFSWPTLAAAGGAGAVLAAPLWLAHVYNALVAGRIRVENAWRQIDVDLKTRHDLIPLLVAAAQGYLRHEREGLEALTALRTRALAANVRDRVGLEARVGEEVGRVIAVVESYPELKAQPLVAKLRRELTALEEKIAHGRSVYNEAVREYNLDLQQFPRVLVARLLGFPPRPYYGLQAEGSREPAR